MSLTSLPRNNNNNNNATKHSTLFPNEQNRPNGHTDTNESRNNSSNSSNNSLELTPNATVPTPRHALRRRLSALQKLHQQPPQQPQQNQHHHHHALSSPPPRLLPSISSLQRRAMELPWAAAAMTALQPPRQQQQHQPQPQQQSSTAVSLALSKRASVSDSTTASPRPPPPRPANHSSQSTTELMIIVPAPTRMESPTTTITTTATSCCTTLTVAQPDLVQAIQLWCHALDALWHTSEWHTVCHAGRHVLQSAAGTMVAIMSWPWQFTCDTTLCVRHSLGWGRRAPHETTKESTTGSNPPLITLIQHVMGFPGFCVEWVIESVRGGGSGSAVDQNENHVNEENRHDDDRDETEATTPSKSKQVVSKENDFLERLRLDVYNDDDNDDNADGGGGGGGAFGSRKRMEKVHHQYSDFLLRVNDLGIVHVFPDDDKEDNISNNDDKKHNAKQVTKSTATHSAVQVHYLDLSDDSTTSKLLRDQVLEQLFHCGVSMIADHPTVRLLKHYKATPAFLVEWKAEGGTSKVLRHMAKQSTVERLATLQKEVLIWSGKFVHQTPFANPKFPLFLARGICPTSPRDFMTLLWDNDRTSEYNNYCLGRTSVCVIDDNVLDGASFGTKVIRSETRVPFTSLSVMVTCMMHVRPLEAPDSGFVILSRSLDHGTAGTRSHTTTIGHDDTHPMGTVDRSKQKNEILWGINVIRRVPGHPHLTDLTSLSQVGSSLVPLFLANKIGMMGVEDFFKNVRKIGPPNN